MSLSETHKQFLAVMQQTRVVRFPRHALATFGVTEIHYNLVTAVSSEPPASLLRTGVVTASRPMILTPESLAQRFEGFGERAAEFEGWLKEMNHEALRALEYKFQNRPENTFPHSLDARELTEKVRRDIEASGAGRTALIQAPEAVWPFALMKFILEETARSFRSNVQELEERGLFDPAQAAVRARRREIEGLFVAAPRDPAALRALGKKLQEYGLFDEYQDRFFGLVKGPAH